MLPGLFDSDPEPLTRDTTSKAAWFAFAREKCPHANRRRTLTVWPGDDHERVTSTCDDCGLVTGFYYDLRRK